MPHIESDGRRVFWGLCGFAALMAAIASIMALLMHGCCNPQPPRTAMRPPLAAPIVTPSVPTRTPTPKPGTPTPTPKPSGVPCSAYCSGAGGCYLASLVGNQCAIGESCVPDCGSVPPTPTPGPGTPTPWPTSVPTPTMPPGSAFMEFLPVVGHPELSGTSEPISFGAQWHPDMSNGGKFGWDCRSPNTGGNGCISITPNRRLVIFGWTMTCGVKIVGSESLFRLWWSPDGTNRTATQIGIGYVPATIAEIPGSVTVHSPPMSYPLVVTGGFIWCGGDAYYPPNATHPASHEAEVTIYALGAAPWQQCYPTNALKGLPLRRFGVKP